MRSCCTELFRRYSPDRRFYLDLHPAAQCTLAWASSWKCSHGICLFQGRENAAGQRQNTLVWWGPDGKKSYWKHSFLPRLQNIYRNLWILLIISDSWSSIKCGMFYKIYLWFIKGKKHGKSVVEQSKHAVLIPPVLSSKLLWKPKQLWLLKT